MYEAARSQSEYRLLGGIKSVFAVLARFSFCVRRRWNFIERWSNGGSGTTWKHFFA
jgi:hypothetical protein